jgi:hypothetical protein
MVEEREYIRTPKTFRACQWFKNGDHPQDKSIMVQGLEGASPSEGKVVRRYLNHHDIDADQLCLIAKCSKAMNDHGWIDSGGYGQTVCPGDFIVNKRGHYVAVPNAEFRSEHTPEYQYGADKPEDKKPKPVPELWSCDEWAERIWATDKDEAISDYAYGMSREVQEGDTVELVGYVHEDLPSDSMMTGYVLDNLMEWLDEDHGDPEDSTKITTALQHAADEFIKVLKQEYRVWRCAQVVKEEVDLYAWCKENQPEALEELGARGDKPNEG